MPPMYRVRFTTQPHARVRAEDVQTVDHQGDLADFAGVLPAGAYVVSVEDLAEERNVHWTRWPAAFRPGARDAATGRVAT